MPWTGTTMPQVSIVIPVHNQPMLILEAVASFKAQSLADWEAILVDDGSTDGTPAVLQNLASHDPRISLWLQTQRGAASARNTGVAKAKADWLLFLDSDDWLAPNALGSLLRVAGQDVHLVHALGLRVCGSRSQDRSQVHLPGGDLFHRLASTATFMVHACILKNSTFHELGGFDETLMAARTGISGSVSSGLAPSAGALMSSWPFIAKQNPRSVPTTSRSFETAHRHRPRARPRSPSSKTPSHVCRRRIACRVPRCGISLCQLVGGSCNRTQALTPGRLERDASSSCRALGSF